MRITSNEIQKLNNTTKFIIKAYSELTKQKLQAKEQIHYSKSKMETNPKLRITGIKMKNTLKLNLKT